MVNRSMEILVDLQIILGNIPTKPATSLSRKAKFDDLSENDQYPTKFPH
jgi:hypothetical protein